MPSIPSPDVPRDELPVDLLAEDVLRSHPAVRDAAALWDGDSIKAFVVADDSYLDEALGREAAKATLLNKWRKTYDLSQRTKEAESAPLGFNILSWDSSYTGQPIPAAAMQEWVDTTVADILRLAPKRVYEIGCGTGLLLTRIAPHCEHYFGVDFAPSVAARLREQLAALPTLANKVRVEERIADNFDGIAQRSFDLVLINSAAQYFPDHTYLTRVLEKSVEAVRSGGHIFIGDVRSLSLMRLFATSVEWFRCAYETTVGELRNRIQRRIEVDPELVLNSTYFLLLKERFPRISEVAIAPRKGYSDTEMTRYRYQAILKIESESIAAPDVTFLNWADHQWTLDEISAMLRKRRDGSFGIQKIRNARLDQDLSILSRLEAASDAATIGQLRHEPERTLIAGIDPQDLELEGKKAGFETFLSWRACRPDGSYDALFVPTRSGDRDALPSVNWPAPDASAFVRFATSPRQGKLRNELVALLLDHCREMLPEKLLPTEIALVDMLPRMLDGQVNRAALLIV